MDILLPQVREEIVNRVGKFTIETAKFCDRNLQSVVGRNCYLYETQVSIKVYTHTSNYHKQHRKNRLCSYIFEILHGLTKRCLTFSCVVFN